MRLVVLYHPDSEFARSVEEYAHDFEHTRGQMVDLLSLESRDGADMAKLYDIVSYPALLAIRDDGQLVKDWEGPALPLMDEVEGYINQ
jgi:hypothetical protein